MTQNVDPKLKQAAEEIRAILKKYDIGATINLVSQSHGEFVIHFPTWSGAQFEEQNRVRIRIKKEEKAKAEATTHLVVSTLQICQMFTENFTGILDELRKRSLIAISPLKITPHDPNQS